MRREADAANMMKEHLRMYPASEQSSAALYFLGRLAQGSGDLRAARAYYDEAVTEYPMCSTPRSRKSARPKLSTVAPAETVTAFLQTVAFPLRSRAGQFAITPAAKARMERASLLASGGIERPGGGRASLRCRCGRTATSACDGTREAAQLRRSREGHALHQTLRARLPADADRYGSQGVLAPRVPPAVPAFLWSDSRSTTTSIRI